VPRLPSPSSSSSPDQTADSTDTGGSGNRAAGQAVRSQGAVGSPVRIRGSATALEHCSVATLSSGSSGIVVRSRRVKLQMPRSIPGIVCRRSVPCGLQASAASRTAESGSSKRLKSPHATTLADTLSSREPTLKGARTRGPSTRPAWSTLSPTPAHSPQSACWVGWHRPTGFQPPGSPSRPRRENSPNPPVGDTAGDGDRRQHTLREKVCGPP
jgi:hypothetical protein